MTNYVKQDKILIILFRLAEEGMTDKQDMIIRRCDEIAQEEYGAADFYMLPMGTRDQVCMKAGEDVAEILMVRAEHARDFRENR